MNFNEQVLQHFGAAHQKLKMIEECSELIHALVRNINQPDYGVDQVVEELVDVKIVLDQMFTLYGRDRVERVEHNKIIRLQERMKNEGKPQQSNS